MLKGGQKLLIQYKVASEANPLNYVLIYLGRKVGVDKNRGYGGSANSSGGGGIAIMDQRDNQTRFMMHGKLTASEAELAAEKVASNRGGGAGGAAPTNPPRRLGC